MSSASRKPPIMAKMVLGLVTIVGIINALLAAHFSPPAMTFDGPHYPAVLSLLGWLVPLITACGYFAIDARAWILGRRHRQTKTGP